MGVGDGIEVDTATDLCGSVLLFSSSSSSCAGMEGEIEAGEAGEARGPCGGVPSSTSPYNLHNDHTHFGNSYSNVEAHEVTDNDTSANDNSLETFDNVRSTLQNLRSKKTKGLILGYWNINSIRSKFEFLKPVAKF